VRHVYGILGGCALDKNTLVNKLKVGCMHACIMHAHGWLACMLMGGCALDRKTLLNKLKVGACMHACIMSYAGIMHAMHAHGLLACMRMGCKHACEWTASMHACA
jgi:hypothetical protein